MEQSLILTLGTLISALVAALVALGVSRSQRRAARETWVMDKRYEAYKAVLKAAFDIFGGGLEVIHVDDKAAGERLRDPAKVTALQQALIEMEMIGTASLGELAVEVHQHVWFADPSNGFEPGKVDLDEVRMLRLHLWLLVRAFRAQLVPKWMRKRSGR